MKCLYYIGGDLKLCATTPGVMLFDFSTSKWFLVTTPITRAIDVDGVFSYLKCTGIFANSEFVIAKNRLGPVTGKNSWQLCPSK